MSMNKSEKIRHFVEGFLKPIHQYTHGSGEDTETPWMQIMEPIQETITSLRFLKVTTVNLNDYEIEP